MTSPDDFTIPVTLGDPDLRSALVAIVRAFESAEACVGPSRSGSSGSQHHKPCSRPPSGSVPAATLVRRLAEWARRMNTRLTRRSASESLAGIERVELWNALTAERAALKSVLVAGDALAGQVERYCPCCEDALEIVHTGIAQCAAAYRTAYRKEHNLDD